MKQRMRTALLSFAIVFTMANTGLASSFSDMRGHWADKYATEIEKDSIIQGYPDGTFRPETLVTRGEYYRMVNQSLGVVKTSEIKFSDVKNKDWYFEEVQKAVAADY